MQQKWMHAKQIIGERALARGQLNVNFNYIINQVKV